VTSYLKEKLRKYAVLTGNIANLRTVLSSRLSHRTAEFTHGIPQFPQFTCQHRGGIISRHSIQQMSIAWYIPFKIPLLTQHLTLSSFRITSWPMWLANSKRSLVFIHHSHTHKKTHRTKKKKKPDKPDEKPVLCQRSFSSVFRAVFYTVKLHGLT
jgi:hypothetical protein